MQDGPDLEADNDVSDPAFAPRGPPSVNAHWPARAPEGSASGRTERKGDRSGRVAGGPSPGTTPTTVDGSPGVQLSSSAVPFRKTGMPPRTDPRHEPLKQREDHTAALAEADRHLLRQLTPIRGDPLVCGSRAAAKARAKHLLEHVFRAAEFLQRKTIDHILELAYYLGQPVLAWKLVRVSRDVVDASQVLPLPPPYAFTIRLKDGRRWTGGDLSGDLREQLLLAHWPTPPGCEVRAHALWPGRAARTAHLPARTPPCKHHVRASFGPRPSQVLCTIICPLEDWLTWRQAMAQGRADCPSTLDFMGVLQLDGSAPQEGSFTVQGVPTVVYKVRSPHAATVGASALDVTETQALSHGQAPNGTWCVVPVHAIRRTLTARRRGCASHSRPTTTTRALGRCTWRWPWAPRPPTPRPRASACTAA